MTRRCSQSLDARGHRKDHAQPATRGCTLIAVVALFASAACDGPPARLVAGIKDTVVVSSRKPVQIPVRVYDAKGHLLEAKVVRYALTSGVAVPVDSLGTVTCTQAGDATVRATLGDLSTDFALLCRPVRDLRTVGMLEFVLGDSAQTLPIEARGLDGRPVPLLSGSAVVSDTTVVALEGLSVRPRSPGRTQVQVRVGERTTSVGVTVYERVQTLERLRPEQRDVVVLARLSRGETRRWRLPPGTFLLSILSERSGTPTPRLAVVGANCVRSLGGYVCLVRGEASVIVYHPWRAGDTRELISALAVSRLADS